MKLHTQEEEQQSTIIVIIVEYGAETGENLSFTKPQIDTPERWRPMSLLLLVGWFWASQSIRKISPPNRGLPSSLTTSWQGPWRPIYMYCWKIIKQKPSSSYKARRSHGSWRNVERMKMLSVFIRMVSISGVTTHQRPNQSPWIMRGQWF